jgi:hypothetical protein
MCKTPNSETDIEKHETTMSPSDKQTTECCGGISIVVSIVMIIIALPIGLSIIPDVEALPAMCNITNVTYPTSIPTIPSEINENFVNCDCGRQCISDIGYCVRVFVEVNSEIVMAGQFSSTTVETQCTFKEDKCFNEEDLASRMEAIQEAEEIASPYVQKMNSSEPIECFLHNGVVFLENQTNFKIEVVAVLGGLSFVALLLGVCCIRKSGCCNF